MQGDGKTSYDVGKDGVPTMIGECAVCTNMFGNSLRFLTNGTGRLSPHQRSDEAQSHLCQRYGIRRTSTRAFLIQSSLSVRVQVKIQWKGCAYFMSFDLVPGPDVTRGRMEQLLYIERHFRPCESVYRSVSHDRRCY